MINKIPSRQILVLLGIFVLLPACTTLKPTDSLNRQVSGDPMEGFNRGVYKFNTAADKAILKPVARGYKAILPKPARNGVRNFFENLNEPFNVVHNLLQGKFDRSLQSTFRFIVNSTIGIGGLFDVADRMQVDSAKEDLGQTLASWGVKPGPYIMLPLLGPTNLRDGVGRIGDTLAYYPIGEITDSNGGQLGLTVLSTVNFRADLLGADELLDAQLDPYGFLKSSFEQNRIRSIYDGAPPQSEEDQELDF